MKSHLHNIATALIVAALAFISCSDDETVTNPPIPNNRNNWQNSLHNTIPIFRLIKL